MFNRTNLHFGGGASHHAHHHVHMVDPSVEKGARFLNEIEEKAADRVLQTLLLDIPSINARAILFEQARNIATMNTETALAFEINGRQYREQIITPDAWGAGVNEARAEVLHSLATAITAQIMTDLCESHLPLVWR